MRPRSIATHCCLGLCVMLLAGCSRKAPVEPPPPGLVPADQDAVLTALQTAYATRDIELLASILAGPEVGTGYRFFLDHPLPDGTTNWGRDEELRIHRRLFEAEKGLMSPDSIPDGLLGAAITGAFVREGDWWVSPFPHPEAPDPSRWRATGALIRTEALFDPHGPNDFRVQGEAWFLVVEDLSKPRGAAGKFLLFRWQELDPCWGPIKAAWR